MPETLSEHTKSVCVAHDCPRCGTEHHVTAERVILGNAIVTRCHCRSCGHSWHPQIEGGL